MQCSAVQHMEQCSTVHFAVQCSAVQYCGLSRPVSPAVGMDLVTSSQILREKDIQPSKVRDCNTVYSTYSNSVYTVYYTVYSSVLSTVLYCRVLYNSQILREKDIQPSKVTDSTVLFN